MTNKTEKVVSFSLPYKTIDRIEILRDQIATIQRKRGNYVDVFKKDVISDCILAGVGILEQELKNQK